jgi:hypothetical protein
MRKTSTICANTVYRGSQWHVACKMTGMGTALEALAKGI